MDKYIFTTRDLILKHAPYWDKYLSEYKDRETHILEIGSFQGQSATWLLDNILLHSASTITCIDPFFKRPKINDKLIFYTNVKATGKENQVIVKEGLSQDELPKLLMEQKHYDIIYIDGSHEYNETLFDCNHSLQLIKPGGIIIIDDYRMSKLYTTDKIGQKPAVDLFLAENSNKFEILNTNFFRPKSRNIIGEQVILKIKF